MIKSDPYFDISFCFDRLLKEYQIHKKLIVAVDFDDTVFDFHNKGFTYPAVIELLKKCQQLGFYIVIFTGADKSLFDSHINYMESLGIKIDSVNKNPVPLPFGNDGKIYYNILLDDRAGLHHAYIVLKMLISYIEENLNA